MTEKGLSKEQDDVDTSAVDCKKGQEKEKTEDKGIRTKSEVRQAEKGGKIYGMENAEKKD